MIFTVDIGGTFTDLVAFNPEGKVVYAKTPTTYGNFAEGVMKSISTANLDLEHATYFKHGTTLVINTLLERTGGKVALITTRGFRDILEIGRGNRPVPFDLQYRRNEHLIPREMRFEITERMDSKGTPLIPVDTEELKSFVELCKEKGIEAIAISFINSYRNPQHEQEVKEYLSKKLPGIFVSASTDMSQKWHEFERTSTAAANAYVGPKVERYINTLSNELKENGFSGRFFLSASNGGVMSSSTAVSLPLNLVESGPVGGVVGTAAMGKILGLNNLIAFDMGGTTAKCTLIENGRFGVESVYDVGEYEKGFPVHAPVIDIVEVGAGGGSIAWIDSVGSLHVGPKSAGSQPGPVAYGWGGIEPTVTDANVILGRLHPERFLGGNLTLQADLAKNAINKKIALPLGFTGEDGAHRAAQGILAIATVIMSGAIKRITVERGRDPRDYSLVAYGGAGPLHAVELARELGIPQVIIPPEPGNFSAIGMLMSDVKRDDVITYLMPVSDQTISSIMDSLSNLEQEARIKMVEDVGNIDIYCERFAEIRYKGQEHSVLTALTGIKTVQELRNAFEETYQLRYGYKNKTNPIEVVSLHVVTTGKMNRPEIDLIALKGGAGEALRELRDVVLPGSYTPVQIAVYDRKELQNGFTASGPCIIEEYGSTTLIGHTDRFEIGPLGEIRILLSKGE